MDESDDVDEDELALAMSTELSRPARAFSDRRTRSFTSLRDAEVNPAYFRNIRSSAGTSRSLLYPITKAHSRNKRSIDWT